MSRLQFWKQFLWIRKVNPGILSLWRWKLQSHSKWLKYHSIHLKKLSMTKMNSLTLLIFFQRWRTQYHFYVNKLNLFDRNLTRPIQILVFNQLTALSLIPICRGSQHIVPYCENRYFHYNLDGKDPEEVIVKSHSQTFSNWQQ